MKIESSLPLFHLAVLVATALSIVLLSSLLPAPMAEKALTEDEGVVEWLAAVLWFANALLLVIAALRRQVRRQVRNLGKGLLSAAFLSAACGFREMGLRKQILASSDLNVMKAPFWISDAVPPAEKILVALALILCVASLVGLLLAYLRPFAVGLRKFAPVAVTVFSALSLLVIAQWIDGGLKGLHLFGLEADPSTLAAHAFEECMELAASLLIFGVAIHTHLPRHTPPQ